MATEKPAAEPADTDEQATPPPLPKALQCTDPDDDQYGAVAVWSDTLGRYGVMTPKNGGHWADEAEVDGWQELAPK